MPDRVVTQYDKEDIEALGLVKIDLLSLRTLGVVSASASTGSSATRDKRIDLDSLPHDDPEVFRDHPAADTVGMFQIESRAQMQALPKARPERFEDLVVQVAIIRPGPVQGNAVHPVPAPARRGRSRSPTSIRACEPILVRHPGRDPLPGAGDAGRDRGVRLHRARGRHLPQGDGLAIGPTRRCRPSATAFIGGAMRTGLTEDEAEELFQRCSAFAEFGFARAHAAAFAKITYDTAWLKRTTRRTTRRRAEQPADGLLLAGRGRRRRQAPRDQGAAGRRQRVGLGARHAPAAGRHATRLRLGMRQVKGIDERARETLERERAIGPYAGVRDFVARTGLGEQVVERLIAHRRLRLDRCAPPRAALAAAHDPGRRQPGASRAGPDR